MNASPLAHPAAALARALTDAGVHVHRIDARRGPRLASFAVALDGADIDRVLRMGRTIAAALDVRGVRMVEWRGGVEVEAPLPRKLWRALTVGDAMHGSNVAIGGIAIVSLGHDARGGPVFFALTDASTPHLFVVGATGSGKTTALRAIVWQLIIRSGDALALVLIDGLASGLAPFRDVPHLALPLAATRDDGAAAIAAVCAELDARIADPTRRTPLVVVVDELAQVTSGSDAAGAGLARIAATGRGLGVHLIACTQHATARVVDRLVSANITTRLVGKVADAAASRLAMGSDRDDARTLMGAGDMLLCRGDDVRRVQVPTITDAEWAMLPVSAPGTLSKNQAHFTLPPHVSRNAVEKSSAPHAGHTPRPVTPDEVRQVAGLWRDGRPPGIVRVKRMVGCGDGHARRLIAEAKTLVRQGGVPASRHPAETLARATTTGGTGC